MNWRLVFNLNARTQVETATSGLSLSTYTGWSGDPPLVRANAVALEMNTSELTHTRDSVSSPVKFLLSTYVRTLE